ncbi:MAG: sugar ABC transporter permease [Bifidobacteriaceae bacterium]|jgi:multiple sugar transport system permease protein|nr:sugar ABC transporter permease [Bifidobacteriaceae bacterium]
MPKESRYKPPRSISRARAEAQYARPHGSKKLARRRNIAGAGFLAPGLAILAVFVFYPTFYAFGLSFTNASGFKAPEWQGFANYARVFTDADTRGAVLHTLQYAIGYAPLVIIVALLMAMLLNRKDIPFRGFFRTVIFLPFIISMAVAALSWSFLIDANTGIIPYWFSQIFHTQMPDLLHDTFWAMPTVIFVAVWKNFGYFMVIFIAGLQGIPRDLYEAAEIDGASAWQRFWSVTLPGLRSTMTYVIILAATGAFQAFDQIYIMTKGGPSRTTETIVYRVYTEGFTNFRQGYASSLAFILMLITMVVGVIQLTINKRQERDLV